MKGFHNAFQVTFKI